MQPTRWARNGRRKPCRPGADSAKTESTGSGSAAAADILNIYSGSLKLDGLKEKRKLTPEQIEARTAEARLLARLERQAELRPRSDSNDWFRLLREECQDET